MREQPRTLREHRSAMTAEPNVTPFLDVLLVLLILFMYLCLNQQKAIMAQLPDPTVRATDNTPGIVLEVLPNARYTINTQPVAGPQLEARLRSIYANRPTKTIIVRGGAGVRYQDVVTAIDIARGAGVVAIGLTKMK
jgi:biopolymer transport protein ExbD